MEKVNCVFFMELVILMLLCIGCASDGVNYSGDVIGGILQGIGAGLSGL